jgi:hypothetical protein
MNNKEKGESEEKKKNPSYVAQDSTPFFRCFALKDLR